jgi:hypothetical protein
MAATNAINMDTSIVIGCNTAAFSVAQTADQILIGHSAFPGILTGETNVLIGNSLGITGTQLDFDHCVIIGHLAGSKLIDDQDIFAIEQPQSNTSNLARPFLFGSLLNGNLALLNIEAMTGGVETGSRIVPAWADAAPVAGQGVFSMYGLGTDLGATTDADFVHFWIRTSDTAYMLQYPGGDTISILHDGTDSIIANSAGAMQLSGTGAVIFNSNSVEGLRLTEDNSGVLQVPSAAVTITAFAGGGQGSAVALIHSYNVITVVATTGDSVRLPAVFAVNSLVYIKNDDAAEAADVFPASGDDLGAGVNTAVSLAAGESLTFIATLADSTWTLLIVDTAPAPTASNEIIDADGDTKVTVEESPDEDIIRFDTGDNVVGYPAQANALVFSSGQFTLALPTADVAATAGGPIALTTGAGLTTGDAGDLTLATGAGGASGDGGFIRLNAGAGGGTLGQGGDILLNAGDGTAVTGTTGTIGIFGGAALAGNRVGGEVRLGGGVGTGFNSGGNVVMVGGDSDPTGSGDGGRIFLEGGESPVGNVGGDGGEVVILGGDCDGTTGAGGAVDIDAGGGGTADGSIGGAIEINAGRSQATNGIGGALLAKGGLGQGTMAGGAVTIQGGETDSGTPGLVSILGGITTVAGAGGAVNITGGAGLTTSPGGALLLTGGIAGATDASVGGAVSLVGGTSAATNGDGGDVNITVGAATGSGADGDILLTGNMLFSDAAGPAVVDEAATSTNPTLIPNKTDLDTGIGWTSADRLALITGGVLVAELFETAGVDPQLILVQNNDPARPTLAFGDGDTGLHEAVDDFVNFSNAGTDKLQFGVNALTCLNNSDSFNLFYQSPAATVPTFVPNRTDNNTGIGHAAADQLSLVAGGLEGLRLAELNSGVIQVPDAQLAITAFAGGGQGSAVPIISSYAVVTVVATAADSVRLPDVFAVNSLITIKNDDSTDACDVFPASGDDLGAGTDTAESLAAGASITYIATVANTTWTDI